MMTQRLDKKPCRVATRARTRLECPFGRLHTRLHPDAVSEFLLNTAVEVDQELHRIARFARSCVHKCRHPWSGRFSLAIGGKLMFELRGVDERKLLRVVLDEEIEGIKNGQVRQEVNVNGKLRSPVRKHVTGEPIAVRVLLPINEMLSRCNLERVAFDPRAAVRSRP